MDLKARSVDGEERSWASALSCCTMPKGRSKEMNTAPGSWAARREAKQEEDREEAEGWGTAAGSREVGSAGVKWGDRAPPD